MCVVHIMNILKTSRGCLQATTTHILKNYIMIDDRLYAPPSYLNRPVAMRTNMIDDTIAVKGTIL